FGSFLYQDKKEHVNRSLPYFSVAMQRFPLALWKMYCVHRYTFKNNHGVTNITPLQGLRRCSLLVVCETIVMLSACETSQGSD
ncbi:hypothetical protein, partial [Tenuifilum sp.]|uniref:hypothetical protein n=1 Tax=Tenuifilum sp. TaxID=2760880 RepID=UPI002C88A00D|nr:hypothetical protein [Tenuifilum sp.]